MPDLANERNGSKLYKNGGLKPIVYIVIDFQCILSKKIELCNYKHFNICGTKKRFEMMEKAYLAIKNVS